MATHRTKVALAVSPKAPPDADGLLAWFQKEGHQLIIQIRDVINWISGKVAITTDDCAAHGHGFLDDKLTVSGGLVKSVVEAGDGTSTLNIDGGDLGKYDFIPYWLGALTSNAAIWGVKVARACTYPAAFAGSYAYAKTAATAECILTIKKNGAAVGTITFAAAGTTGTFAASAQTDLAAGDLLEIWTPAVADATLAYVGVSLKGAQA